MLRRKLNSSLLLVIMPSAAFGVLQKPAQATDTVTVELTGTIDPACSLGGAAPASLGALDAAGAAAFSFAVDCNTGFTVEVSSANGGLGYSGAPVQVAGGNFATSVPYRLSLDVPTDGAPLQIASCPSTLLKTGSAGSCRFADSGAAAAIGGAASVKLAWDASSTPLLGGEYSDTLTFTFAAKP